MVCSWRYVHDDVYGDLSLAVCRLTLHPWQLAPMVHNSVLTDRSRNHPGFKLSMKASPNPTDDSSSLSFTSVLTVQISLAVAQISLASLDSHSRNHWRRSISQSLGSVSLLRSLDSHSRSYSAWIVAVTRIARKSRA
ncbi:hypothetical protein Bca52824_051559 [Brassica carinata]|uniref:Uncharacterized protein n=1 Tax=Brassica carinata TaxID=52824 RepID=A0A8X7R0M6_BRACI|nr:hypothetical protein Bca52824_051559 [Brassica carinata]